MNIDMIFKIAAIGILISVLAQVLNRAGREEIATLTTLAGLVIVLILVVNMIADFFTDVKAIFQLY
ncbi:MAG: stage III sporulation protein AC [Clostridiales bacterium]|nr:stage III sporulation protein AC [Clostridiales bacterium]